VSDYTVELHQISKSFPSAHGNEAIVAVDNLNLLIKAGEFFTLLGPSGCGKTTTLRLIAGFEVSNSGEILIHGKRVNNIPPHRRPVNTVFQSYALFPHLSVEQNVAYALTVKHVPFAERKQRTADALALVRLTGMENRKPSELSGGQQQRVALARALINRPAVLLLDEPLGALDLKLRKEMQVELKLLQAQLGITFIYVTHDQEEALTMSDRIAVMNQGRILQVDSPLAIYDHPSCRFVADFIGETNFLHGQVEHVENGIVQIRVAGEPIVVRRGEVQLSDHQQVALAIRPEKFMISKTENGVSHENGDSGEIALSGFLRNAIYLGTDTRYIVELSSGENVSVRVQNAGNHGPGEFDLGEQVKLRCEPDDARVLTD
jgi:spermidine/putrescine transport system ATP-binding protein